MKMMIEEDFFMKREEGKKSLSFLHDIHGDEGKKGEKMCKAKDHKSSL